jgi:hypothetical protein
LGIIYSLGLDGPADPGPACPADLAEAGETLAGDSSHPVWIGPAVPAVAGPSVPARDAGTGGSADPVTGPAVPAGGPIDPWCQQSQFQHVHVPSVCRSHGGVG